MNNLDRNAPIVVDAFNRHSDNPDWYGAQLAVAAAHTDSLEEAIQLADLMYEENPEPPETSDEEESAALEKLGETLRSIF